MHKRELDELAIYQLEGEADDIDIGFLHDLYVEKTSDIVYLTLDDKLYGIICYGDLLHHMHEGVVRIVKNFTSLNDFCDNEARKIFASKKNIHKIPVLDKEDKLLGDYSRWEDGDTGWIHWIMSQSSTWSSLRSYIKEKEYQKVYIVNSIKEKLWIKDIIIELFESKKINIFSIDKIELSKLLQEKDKSLVITVDEEELRGINCIDGYVYSTVNDKFDWCCFSSLYHELVIYNILRFLNSYGIAREGDNVKKKFMELQQKGINVVTIHNDIFYLSDYIKGLLAEVDYQRKIYNLRDDGFCPINSDWGESFYGELLQNEDYQTGTAQKNISYGFKLHVCKSDITYLSKYYNVINGHRKTLYQPQNYVGKIYIFGSPCVIMGINVEDQYTIASMLQKKLNDAGYRYCVENCGSFMNVFIKMKEITYHKRDIIIVWTGDGDFSGIDTVEIRRLYEENNVPPEWFTDVLAHGNHRINDIIGEALYKQVRKYLKQGSGQIGTERDKDVLFTITDYADVMGNYVWSKYLNKYFVVDDMAKYIWGGVIVDLHISPDVYEKILRKVSMVTDHVVVFVPKNILGTEYNFQEYICAMQKIALKGIEIKVVPGEGVVPYAELLGTYYEPLPIKIEDARQEIKFWAECIARPLNIKYRFDVGQHTIEKMILYSQIVKEELPQYGIEYIEFL